MKFNEKKRPQQAHLSVITRFGRMPRGGWNKGSDVFNAMFITNVDTQEFNKRAQKVLTNSNGKKSTNLWRRVAYL